MRRVEPERASIRRVEPKTVEEENFCPNCKRKVRNLKRHQRSCNRMKKILDDATHLDAYLDNLKRHPVERDPWHEENRYLNYYDDDIPETTFKIRFTKRGLLEEDWTPRKREACPFALADRV
eukprot:TRINITY_DN5188_c0_g1_i1.p1 TRINITY_DN5188_c0_g1~~TRINITY_DN5188_c0_g1_i1.p1  ORF type:complete len:122 (-),score=16.50 TRINITY_DN5188_c0_g1_i1:110-475(-)